MFSRMTFRTSEKMLTTDKQHPQMTHLHVLMIIMSVQEQAKTKGLRYVK